MTAAQSASLHPLSFAAMLMCAADHVAREQAVPAFVAEQTKMAAANRARALQIIIDHGRVTTQELSSLVGVAKATSSVYVRDLIKSGYITRATDGTAGGRYVMEATAEGRAARIVVPENRRPAVAVKPPAITSVDIGHANAARVLEIIRETSACPMTTKQIADTANLNEWTVFNNAKKLEACRLVRRIKLGKCLPCKWEAVEVSK